MDKLNLTPQQYFKRVYFQGLGHNGGPQSLKLLQSIFYKQSTKFLKNKGDTKEMLRKY